MKTLIKIEIQDQIEAIEARPLSRVERDRLEAPLLALLRLCRTVETVQRMGFSAMASGGGEGPT